MRRFVFTFFVTAGFAATVTLSRASIVAFEGSYSQNFNSLAAGSAWQNGSTLQGWYAYNANGGQGQFPDRPDNGWAAMTSYQRVTGQYQPATALLSVGETWNSTDRALGTMTTTSDIMLALVLQNASTTAFDTFSLNFYTEQWQIKNSVGKPLDFTWTISPSFNPNLPNPNTILPQADGNPSDASGLNQGYVNPAGGVLDPRITRTSDTALPLDGNAPENRIYQSGDFAVNWQPGEYLVLRWWDDWTLDVGPVSGLDDMAISAHAIPPVSTVPELGNTATLMMAAVGCMIGLHHLTRLAKGYRP